MKLTTPDNEKVVEMKDVSGFEMEDDTPTQDALRILLLEDVAASALLLSRALRNALDFVQVATCRTISEAQVLTGEYEFDLYIVDIHLPDGSGFDFLSDVLTAQPDVPAIVITGSTDVEARNRARELGVAHFLPKPFEAEVLVQVVWRALIAVKQRKDEESEYFSGSLTHLTPFDVVQLKCLGGIRQAIEFVSGEKRGRIYVDHGELIHAEVGELSGPSALQEIMSWQGGWLAEISDYENPERTIMGYWQSILIEASHNIETVKDNA
jgi:CheY-like chemotaxis protein